MQDPPIGHSSDPPDRDPSGRRNARRFTIGLALVALIGAALYVSTRPLGGTLSPSRTGDGGSPAAGNATVGPGIGQPAPDFISADAQTPLLRDLDGAPIRLGDFAGRPLWIVFWATWCIPCQDEASAIRAAYRAHRGQNLAVLAVDVQEPAAAVRAFALNRDLDYAIGLDTTAAVKTLYGGWGLPSHFFVGADGVIRDRYLGQMTADLMEQHLRAILGS
jgi:cytochrome c biogenesis protein CcmG/thiol:disulfide interchange protein DsbE